ncbi:MAG: sel1 repeat family protein [Prevotellaceae bacterium]|nr:sel1 repeat family protein [Candidatus Minthosoma caballi]
MENEEREVILKKAEAGDPEAQFLFGCSCESRGKAKSAFKWFAKSADKGYAKAQWKMACYYDMGAGVDKDSSKAFAWAMKAAEQNDDCAMNYVGYTYREGIVVEQDLQQAKHWLTKAAEMGNRNARYNLKHFDEDPSERKERISSDDVEHIELTPENYKDYLPLDFVAVSYAEAGAMGIEGDVTMISFDKKIYSLNYLYNDWGRHVVPDIIESLGEDRHYVDLGMGNHLFVSESIWEDFDIEVNVDYLRRIYYRGWIDAVLNILQENDVQTYKTNIRITNIHIEEADEFFPSDIVAYFVSMPDADSESGVIIMVDKEACFYKINYYNEAWSKEELTKFIPEECFNVTVPDSWLCADLGAKKYLYVHKSIRDAFESTYIDCYDSGDFQLGKVWKEILNDVVHNMKTGNV